ncbi:MAG: CAP domain-containing protein [Solirubrobacterales bacterium]
MGKRIFYVFLAVVIGLVFASTASARSIAYHADEVAPAAVCPGQTAAEPSVEEQVTVMLCMTNYARQVNHLAALSRSRPLQRAAEQKSSDIVACDDFSHEACGRPFTFWDQRYGYLKGCWRAGENIAWGTGTYSTVRAIFTAWLQSPEHHANILGPYREIGIGLRVGAVEGNEGAAVWTQDFGSHKC